MQERCVCSVGNERTFKFPDLRRYNRMNGRIAASLLANARIKRRGLNHSRIVLQHKVINPCREMPTFACVVKWYTEELQEKKRLQLAQWPLCCRLQSTHCSRHIIPDTTLAASASRKVASSRTEEVGGLSLPSLEAGFSKVSDIGRCGWHPATCAGSR